MTSQDDTKTSEHDTLRSIATEFYRESFAHTAKATPQELALSVNLLGSSFVLAGIRHESKGLKVAGFVLSITASTWYGIENQRRARRAALDATNRASEYTKLADEINAYLDKRD